MARDKIALIGSGQIGSGQIGSGQIGSGLDRRHHKLLDRLRGSG